MNDDAPLAKRRVKLGTILGIAFLILLPILAIISAGVAINAAEDAERSLKNDQVERLVRQADACRYSHDRLASERRAVARAYRDRIRDAEESIARLSTGGDLQGVFNLTDEQIRQLTAQSLRKARRRAYRQFYNENGNDTLPFYCAERMWPERPPDIKSWEAPLKYLR